MEARILNIYHLEGENKNGRKCNNKMAENQLPKQQKQNGGKNNDKLATKIGTKWWQISSKMVVEGRKNGGKNNDKLVTNIRTKWRQKKKQNGGINYNEREEIKAITNTNTVNQQKYTDKINFKFKINIIE